MIVSYFIIINNELRNNCFIACKSYQTNCFPFQDVFAKVSKCKGKKLSTEINIYLK